MKEQGKGSVIVSKRTASWHTTRGIYRLSWREDIREERKTAHYAEQSVKLDFKYFCWQKEINL